MSHRIKCFLCTFYRCSACYSIYCYADEWFGLSTRVFANEFIPLQWHFDVNWMTANNHFGKALTIFVHLFSMKMRVKWWLWLVLQGTEKYCHLICFRVCECVRVCVCVWSDGWLWFSGLVMGGNMISSGEKDYCIAASGGQVHTFMVWDMEKNVAEK